MVGQHLKNQIFNLRICSNQQYLWWPGIVGSQDWSLSALMESQANTLSWESRNNHGWACPERILDNDNKNFLFVELSFKISAHFSWIITHLWGQGKNLILRTSQFLSIVPTTGVDPCPKWFPCICKNLNLDVSFGGLVPESLIGRIRFSDIKDILKL